MSPEAGQPNKTAFDEMVNLWMPEIRARFYGNGVPQSDEAMEAEAESLGLSGTEMTDAFYSAKTKVDLEMQATPKDTQGLYGDLLNRAQETAGNFKKEEE